jgi:hypothetical protein
MLEWNVGIFLLNECRSYFNLLDFLPFRQIGIRRLLCFDRLLLRMYPREQESKIDFRALYSVVMAAACDSRLKRKVF